MKKNIMILLSVLTLLFNVCASAAYADDGISVTLNGQKLQFDVPPQMIDNRTMVPLRKIFEAMGATVVWNNDTQTVTARKNSEYVIATVNKKDVNINGVKKTLDVPPMIVDSRTLVPVRFVAEAFGADVFWDGAAKNVVITTKWDRTGNVPCYEHYPEVPDFGAIAGLRNIGNEKTGSNRYNIKNLDKAFISDYLNVMGNAKFQITKSNDITVCRKGSLFVDISIEGDELSLVITQ